MFMKRNNSEYYCTFNIVSGAKKVWNIENLGVDGHPNVFGDDEFIRGKVPMTKENIVLI